MGWWKYEDDAVVGDPPLDEMDKAIDRIRQIYQTAWKREVTDQELQILFDLSTKVSLVETNNGTSVPSCHQQR